MSVFSETGEDEISHLKGEEKELKDECVQITIEKILTGDKIAFDMKTTASIDTVKDAIHESWGIPRGRQRLMYGLTELRDGTLADNNIHKESTIHLLITSTVEMILESLCPENLKTALEQMPLERVESADELHFVVIMIFEKALQKTHFSETYADMVVALRTQYPEKACAFLRMLLNTCQHEFESFPGSLEPNDEEKTRYTKEALNLEMKKRTHKMLACIRFIGHLFIRQLIAFKVIGHIFHHLVGLWGGLPQEHMIECVCELLHTVGPTLESTHRGRMLMSEFSARLIGLKGDHSYSEHIRSQIGELLDLRFNQWNSRG